MIVTFENRNSVQVLPYSDPGDLPPWDLHGYEIAYYVVKLLTGYDKADEIVVEKHDDGTPMVRHHTGDVLCGGCASAGDMLDADEGLDVAYQSMMEVGNAEAVHCDHCHGVIYDPDA